MIFLYVSDQDKNYSYYDEYVPHYYKHSPLIHMI